MKRPSPAAVRRGLPGGVGELVDAILVAAERQELGVHLVGGPVRDFLLERELRDVDLVVEPSGGRGAIELARETASPGARVVAHARFGTVKLVTASGSVDLATVRSESYARPGALPRVQSGSLQEDLERRDFTVNALAIPLTTVAQRGRARIIDAGRGRADLEARRLRVFHARSFHDDPTRALRAARLAPRLGFALARSTRAALRDALRDGAFAGVSGERYRAELERVFSDAALGLDPARALRHLADWHVLAALEPGLALAPDGVAMLRRLGRLSTDACWSGARPWVAGLMVWLGGLESGLRRRALERLAVRGDVADRVRGFPRARDRWRRGLARARGRGAADKLLRGVPDEELLALAAGCEAAARRRILRFVTEDRGVQLPVTGEDLMEAGLAGPAVGRALDQIRIAVLDRSVRSRDDALALARELDRGGRRGRGALLS